MADGKESPPDPSTRGFPEIMLRPVWLVALKYQAFDWMIIPSSWWDDGLRTLLFVRIRTRKVSTLCRGPPPSHLQKKHCFGLIFSAKSLFCEMILKTKRILKYMQQRRFNNLASAFSDGLVQSSDQQKALSYFRQLWSWVLNSRLSRTQHDQLEAVCVRTLSGHW